MRISSHTSPEIVLQQIWQLIHNKQIDKALTLVKELNESAQDFAPGWHVASVIAWQTNNIVQALFYIESALDIQPQNSPWRLHKAKLLLVKGERLQASNILSDLALSTESSLEYSAELALLLNKIGQHKLAADWYRKALQYQPNNPQLLFNLASMQRFMGNIDEAQTTLNKVIDFAPADTEAWLLRSNLKKQTKLSNHIDELQQALKQPLPAINKTQLYYALAKELEDTQQYQQSFQALESGAAIRRKNMQYNPAQDIDTLHQLSKSFNREFFTKPDAGHPSKQPIFILGLPRTGSTLVERIISSHSEVFSAGELNNFSLEMMAQVRNLLKQPPVNKQALIAATTHLDFAQLGSRYIESTLPDTQHYARFVDKLPLNSLNIGLIHRALPQAKIIYVQRNPMDTCFAMFKQIFTQGYPFSYDLKELSEYQIAHFHLMQHWKEILQDKMFVIQYEDLVTDVEFYAKKLLTYCELPWQQQCSQFFKNNAVSTTASATQVRQPVYTSSVNKWQHYSEQLSSVKKRFQQAGLICD